MNLRDFPFDMDDIKVKFRTYSSWSTFDGESWGSCPKGKTYRLRQIREKGEGRWLDMYWSGRIAEWKLQDVPTAITEQPQNVLGLEATEITLSLHVTRMAGFYF